MPRFRDIKLLYFLFQRVKQLCTEKFAQRDTKSVAEFLYIDNAGILAFLIEHRVNSHRRYARKVGNAVYCQVLLLA